MFKDVIKRPSLDSEAVGCVVKSCAKQQKLAMVANVKNVVFMNIGFVWCENKLEIRTEYRLAVEPQREYA